MKNKKSEALELITKIAKRAENMGLLMSNKMSLIMDLEYAEEFDLRLEDLLNADNYNFAHDICGIQNNLNRQTKKMDNYFVPRFSSKWEKR